MYLETTTRAARIINALTGVYGYSSNDDVLDSESNSIKELLEAATGFVLGELSTEDECKAAFARLSAIVVKLNSETVTQARPGSPPPQEVQAELDLSTSYDDLIPPEDD